MNARLRHGAVLLFVLIASFITGYVRTPPVHHRPPVQDPNPLGEVLAAVDIEDGTYAATLSYLSRISHANIVANWTALHQLEVEPATMLHINLHLRNVPLREVLNIICSHYEEPHPTIDVYRWTGYLVESGIIIFTMRSPGSDESNEVVTRSYDVSHLMDRLEGLQIVELPDADTGSRRWAQRNAAERLVFLICAMIDPDSWYSAGGIQRFYRKLLVTQTPENQEKVRRFLQTLDTASQPPAKN